MNKFFKSILIVCLTLSILLSVGCDLLKPEVPDITPDIKPGNSQTSKPGGSSQTPSKPSGTNPSGTPETPSGTPDAPSGTPDIPSGTPDIPSGTPSTPGFPNWPWLEPEQPEEIDPNPIQLYVGVMESGVGRLWIDKLKSRYEELNPGVQIIVDYRGQEFSSSELKRTMSSIRHDVIFSNNIIMNDIVENPEEGTLLEDITDIVTKGGDNSIYSKMWDSYKYSAYNYGTAYNPVFYTLPYFSTNYGMVYDRDMFEAYELFGLSDYKGLDCIEGTEDDNLGPDGVANTYDDGLPATWEDMKILLKTLVDKDIIPFVYSGKDGYVYQDRWLSSIWASYEGANDYSLLTSLNGTDSQFGTITPENAWQLAKQDGKKAALMVADYLINSPDMIKNGNTRAVHPESKIGAIGAMDAQTYFIDSYPNPEMQDIAFLIEGDWWENESRAVFDASVEYYDDDKWGYGERNFGYFPFPKFKGSFESDGIPDQTNEMTTIGDSVGNAFAAGFINKYSDVKEEAKKFLEFCYSDEANAIFTEITGLMRPFDYELTSTQYDSLTPYQRSLWDMQHSENSKIDRVIGSSRSNLYYYKRAYVKNAFGFAARIPGVVYEKMEHPLSDFWIYSNDILTAESYFENPVAGQDVLNEANWNEVLGDYFN